MTARDEQRELDALLGILDLVRARRALREYANPRNWSARKSGWVYIGDQPPWGLAADALEDVDA